MLKQIIQWFKGLFRSLFAGKRTTYHRGDDVIKQPPPPLTDTDLEFLFNQLIEGVHQARGQAWAQKWLHNIEHRVSTERWVQWLRHFGERLLASPRPNNELAARLVQLGDLGVGEVGNVAHEIGMQLLTRFSEEPVWEYDGPDAINTNLQSQNNYPTEQVSQEEKLPTEGVAQTVTPHELLIMLQEDENLRQQIAQQLAIETDDPQLIVQELINQYYASSQSNSDET